MAEFFSHILFADEVLDMIQDTNIKSLIKNHIKLYYLGAQGPDIFYYNNILNIKEKKLLNNLGDMLHTKDTENFFEESFVYLKKRIKNKDEYQNLLVYLLGFLCHFSLDCAVHPYIYYLTGFYDENDKKTKIYKSYHKKLEIVIDVLMMKLKKNEKASSLPTYRLIDNGKSLPIEIEIFLQYVIKKVYGRHIDKKTLGNNYIYLKNYRRLLYDPKNIKKYIVLFNIKLFKWTKYYYYNFYPNRVDKIDFLNLNNNIWQHPVTGDRYTSSIITLFNNGEKQGLKYINDFIDYLSNEDGDCFNIVPDISYLTALPCEDKRDMRYFNIIFHRIKKI